MTTQSLNYLFKIHFHTKTQSTKTQNYNSNNTMEKRPVHL